MKKNKAFYLVELSISLLVIGTLMAIVAGSTKLIASARLTSARSLTARSPVPKIEGLVAWYETSRRESFKPSEAVDDGQISAWYDVSPGSIAKQKNTLGRTASSGVIYQTSGINKLPSVYFKGDSGIGLANFYQGSSKQNTVFYAIKPSFTTTAIIVDSGPSSSVAAFGLKLSNQLIHFNYGYTKNIPISPLTLLTNQDYLGAIYYNGANSKAFINNATTMISEEVCDPGPNSLKGIMIGSDRNNLYRFTGLISEIIVYNRPLQTQERKDVMNYLGQKYGITVTGI